MNTIYIPLIARTWGNVQMIGIPFEARFDASFGNAFMPVFASKEEAKKHYPDAEILEADLPIEETNHD
jgi:hypothetical protein